MRTAIRLFLPALALAALSTGCPESGGDPAPGDATRFPCSGSTDCNDDDPCTVDRCIAGYCDNVARDCDDDDPCTEDSCHDGTCLHRGDPGCCSGDGDCDDGDFCTPDRCVDRACVSDPPVDDCCNEASGCDDQDVCTYDDCIQHRCTHLPDASAGCCEVDKDCLDGNACTEDRCVGGMCSYTNRGCCETVGDCTPAGACEVVSCQDQKCAYTPIAGCCTGPDDCEVRTCSAADCIDGECQWTVVDACCTADGDCGDPCLECSIPFAETAGTCTVKTTGECCRTTLLDAPFDNLSGPAFDVEGMAGAGYSGTPRWVIDTKRSVSAPSSLYFGDPATHRYEDGATSKAGGRAVSPELDLSRTMAPTLTFQMYKDTDITKGTDVLSVIVVASGKEDRVAWSTATRDDPPTTNGAWEPVTVSLSPFQGETVRVAFQFDTVDVYPTPYEGTYVDDARVQGRCAP